MLEHLKLTNVGPADEMEMTLGSRLNVITGDNGLGKSLLLDAAWFALTNTWPQAWPGRGIVPTQPGAVITWQLTGREGRQPPTHFPQCRWEYGFAERGFEWSRTQGGYSNINEEGPRSLVVYARVDGGFSVADPTRVPSPFKDLAQRGKRVQPDYFHFSADQVWDGLDVDRNGVTKRACEGLLRDWLTWAAQPDEPTRSFVRLGNIIGALSPGQKLVPLKKARRVFADDVRDIPLLMTETGEVPVVHTSAAVRRMLALAYVLVWTVREHHIATQYDGSSVNSLILLFDEVETHLHPRWQRQIAHALVAASKALDDSVDFQALVTTHSPLVLASLEPIFDEQTDRLFHLGLEYGRAHLGEQPWAKQGDVVNWLVSDTFGLQQARSIDAERAIEAAEAWMRGDRDSLPKELMTQEAIHQELLRVLAGHDDFWPRWIVRSEKGGFPV